MDTRMVNITFDEAIELYNSGNENFKKLALKSFTEEELSHSFKIVQTLQDACLVLNIDTFDIVRKANDIAKVSKASAAMFKLNIIRKALNLGQELYLTKNSEDSYIYYPYNPFVTKSSTYYKSRIDLGEMEVIGKIKIEGEEYDVLGGDTIYGDNVGLGCFISDFSVGTVDANVGFLGCATEEMAKHFGKYFGMLITEAKYGDLPEFTIIEEKYHHL